MGNDVSPIHVMHIIDSLDVGGAEQMLIEISNATARAGMEVSVCITRFGTALASKLHLSIPCFVLNRKSRFDIMGFLRFRRILNLQRPDILHVHGLSSYSFVCMAKLLGIIHQPLLFHDHDGWVEQERPVPFWFRLIGKRFLSGYAGVYSKFANWAKKARIPEPRIRIIENALNLSPADKHDAVDLRKELSVSQHIPLAVLVGGIRFQKGLHVLIDAITMSKYGKSAHYVVIGSEQDIAYANFCRSRMENHHLQKNISFIGQRLDVLNILLSVDFAVMPSVSESGPLVLIEYLAAGLPVVGARVGSVSLRFDRDGLPGLVPPNDPAALAEGLDELLLLSPELRRQRGSLGRSIALKYFDMAQRVVDWIDFYKFILDKRLV
jgi:glycosyltransferase involved in cell wall biosynthesis